MAIETPGTLPPPPGVVAVPRGTWPGVAVCLAVGIAFDAAVAGRPGVGLSAAVALTAGAVAVLGGSSRRGWPFLAGAVVVAGWISIRASSLLIAIDVIAAASLLAIGATLAGDGRLGRTTSRAYAVRAWLAPWEAVPEAAGDLSGPPARLTAGRERVAGSFARAALLVVPIVALLVLLFASADRAFANLIHTPVLPDAATMVRRLAVVAIGSAGAACLIAAARRRSIAVDQAERPLRIGWSRPAEWLGLLVAVDLVFALFVVVQFAVFFGGDERVRSIDGLTYAGYARGGFWQLLGATAIAGAVLSFGWLSQRTDRSPTLGVAFTASALTLVALVLVVLVSAFLRLRLYEEAFGFTPLRVLVHTTIVAIGVLLVCAGVAIAVRAAWWLPTAALATAVAAVLALNAANVDAVVARENLRRAVAGAPLDVGQLERLSPDAVGPAIELLPDLQDADRDAVRRWLACEARLLGVPGGDGWASANLGRARALDRLTETVTSVC
jgi:hypothetical protein